MNSSNKIDFTFFSNNEISLIMGTLLGDGHLNKRGESYRMKIDHGLDQKDYVLWKRKKLERLCRTTQEPKETLDKKGIEFYTSSSNEYKAIHSLFYHLKKVKEKSGKEKEKYVKVITRELIDNLPTNPLVLATFYMDDGSVRNDCYAGKLATQGFSQEESKLLCEYIEKCGIKGAKVVLHLKKTNQYYISLPSSGNTFADFVKYIQPVVQEVPTMIYKLNEDRKPKTP